MSTSDNSISVEDRRRFGSALARAMELRGVSQTQLGQIIGAHQSVVSNWIHGKYAAPPRTVFAIEEHLGLTPGHLSSVYGYYPLTAFQRTDLDSALVDTDEFDATEKAAIQALIEALRTVRARHETAAPAPKAKPKAPRAGTAAARAKKAATPVKKAAAKRPAKLSSVGAEG